MDKFSENFRLQDACCCKSLKLEAIFACLLTLFAHTFLVYYFDFLFGFVLYEHLGVLGTVIYFFGSCIFYGLLILGVYQKKPILFLPVLYLKAIECFAWMILIILTFIEFFHSLEKIYLLVLFMVDFIWTTLFIYFWLVIWSYYEEFKMNAEEPVKCVEVKEKGSEQYKIDEENPLEEVRL